LAKFLAHTGMDRDAELLDRLVAARAEQDARGGRNHERAGAAIGQMHNFWFLPNRRSAPTGRF
jgi:hypothetical protein